MAMVPLIYLAYHYIVEKPKMTNWTYRLAWPSLLLILGFRMVLVFDVLPRKTFPLAYEFHGWEEWAADLETVITRRPALFFNSYQRAAKYSFYSNGQGYALITVGYAGNQYDLLTETQENLQGKRIVLVRQLSRDQKGLDLGKKDRVYVQSLEEFYFYNRLKINILDAPTQLEAGAEV